MLVEVEAMPCEVASSKKVVCWANESALFATVAFDDASDFLVEEKYFVVEVSNIIPVGNFIYYDISVNFCS